MRKPHFLGVNQRTETIHNCVFYDTETTGIVGEDGDTRHRFEFGWGAYRRRGRDHAWNAPEWRRFDAGEVFWSWVDSKARAKKTLYVWAHNHAFDYSASNAHKSLKALGWRMTAAIVDSPPFVVTYRNGNRKLVLVDTLNIWRMSLKSMGKLNGLAKLEMPASWSGSRDDDVYCRRDVEIVMYAVCQWADFLQEHDMGKFQLTIASQAMQTFRHKYLRDRILIDCDPSSLEIARKAYHGGRVEANFIGQIQGPLYMLDVNSLYPYVMSRNCFPVRLCGVFDRPSFQNVEDILARYCCCARIIAECREPVIPVVKHNKLIFPTGTFEAYVSTPELEYLVRTEQLQAVQTIAVYEQARPFQQFVQDLYEHRLQAIRSGDLVKKEHYKLLLNSFYGKWGQNGIKWKDIGPAETDDIGFWRTVDAQSGLVTKYRRFNGLEQIRTVDPESSNSHPAIAAHITAHARMVLYAIMRQVTVEHYFYCDTDSILVTEQGFKVLRDRISDEIMGHLKLVRQVEKAVIYGCKDYVLDGVVTCKGIRQDADNPQGSTFRQVQWFGFNGQLRSGSLEAPRTTFITKKLRRVYEKGIVDGSGFVFPFHLDS
jgi:DNA polymerase type B, organellar and viral